MSAKGLVSLLLVLISTCGLVNAINDPCIKQNGCYCQSASNEFIDITPIGSLRFNVTDSQGAYHFKFQLCQSFTFGNCSSVYGCQYNELSDVYNDIADSSPVFMDTHTIKYTGSENRTTIVTLYCSTNETLTLTDSSDPKLTKFILTTSYACPKALTSTVTPQTTNTTATTVTTTVHSNTTATTVTTTAPSNTTAPNTTAHSNTTTVTSPTTTVTSPTTAASNTTSLPTTSPSHNTTAPVVTTTPIASTTHSGESMSRRPQNLGFIMAIVCLTNRLLSWR